MGWGTLSWVRGVGRKGSGVGSEFTYRNFDMVMVLSFLKRVDINIPRGL